MLLYLFLDTPLPFEIILGDMSFVIITMLSLVLSCFIYKSTNVFVTIIYLVVLYEVLQKIRLQKYKTLSNNDKPAPKQYYFKDNPNVILTNKFDKTLSLEEEMVYKIPNKVKSPIMTSSKYKPVLLTSDNAADINN
jgi:hypothetical protein